VKTFGLIGFPLTHSFSKKYFSEKFENENIKNCQYELFEIEDINSLKNILESNPSIAGLNVTIPHKRNIIPFLHSLDRSAKNVGAVNVIKFAEGNLIGFNSDYYGFMESLKRFVGKDLFSLKALILGTGGAAMAVQAALKDLNIPFVNISRSEGGEAVSYDKLNATNLINTHQLIINTTPLGMYPKIDTYPPIQYEELTDRHFLFDLVYNPQETEFLKRGKLHGSRTKDGLEMLYLQAEKAWEIWNS
jgi:shikimate dehydrogenase